jgi:hypothetical protein
MGIPLLFLSVSFLMGFLVFRAGRSTGWHWFGALAAAVVPVAFTFFLGLIGLFIAIAYTMAIYKSIS